MKVHVLTEPALAPVAGSSGTYSYVWRATSWLIKVPICLCNMSLHAVEVPAKTVVGQVTPATW